MRSLWILMLLVLSLVAQAEENLAENLYAKHYQVQGNRGLASIQAAPKTELLRGDRRKQDDISMLERGYDLMGSASFEAGEVSPDQALAHGQNIKADTVLVYADKARNATPVGKMAFIKEAVKKGQVLTEADVKETARFDYYATFWAKLPPPILGVHVIKLQTRDPETDTVVEQPGLKVIAVIRDSPAEHAGLQRGDVLLKIEDLPVDNPESLSQLVRGFQGQAVNIAFTRTDEPKMTSAQLNKR